MASEETLSATQAVLIFFAVILILVTIIGNGCFLAIFFRFKLFRESFTNTLLASQAVIDSFNALFNVPLFTLYFVVEPNWLEGKAFSIISNSFQMEFNVLNLVSMTVLMLDRFLAVYRGLKYFTWKTTKKAKIAVFLMWLACTIVVMLAAIPVFYMDLDGVPLKQATKEIFQKRKLFTAPLISTCTVTSTVFGVMTCYSIHQKKKERKKLNLPALAAEARLQMDIKATYTVIMTVAVYYICYIPTVGLATYNGSKEPRVLNPWLVVVAFVTFLSGVLSPVIYVIRSRRNRSAIRQLVKDPCGKSPYRENPVRQESKVKQQEKKPKIEVAECHDHRVPSNSPDPGCDTRIQTSLAQKNTEIDGEECSDHRNLTGNPKSGSDVTQPSSTKLQKNPQMDAMDEEVWSDHRDPTGNPISGDDSTQPTSAKIQKNPQIDEEGCSDHRNLTGNPKSGGDTTQPSSAKSQTKSPIVGDVEDVEECSDHRDPTGNPKSGGDSTQPTSAKRQKKPPTVEDMEDVEECSDHRNPTGYPKGGGDKTRPTSAKIQKNPQIDEKECKDHRDPTGNPKTGYNKTRPSSAKIQKNPQIDEEECKDHRDPTGNPKTGGDSTRPSSAKSQTKFPIVGDIEDVEECLDHRDLTGNPKSGGDTTQPTSAKSQKNPQIDEEGCSDHKKSTGNPKSGGDTTQPSSAKSHTKSPIVADIEECSDHRDTTGNPKSGGDLSQPSPANSQENPQIYEGDCSDHKNPKDIPKSCGDATQPTSVKSQKNSQIDEEECKDHRNPTSNSDRVSDTRQPCSVKIQKNTQINVEESNDSITTVRASPNFGGDARQLASAKFQKKPHIEEKQRKDQRDAAATVRAGPNSVGDARQTTSAKVQIHQSHSAVKLAWKTNEEDNNILPQVEQVAVSGESKWDVEKAEKKGTETSIRVRVRPYKP